MNNKFLKITGGIILGASLAFLFVFGTMHLWNYLAVDLFHAPVITFWQTAGLMLLGRLIAGGFRGSGGWGRKRGYGMRNRWKNMTEEERTAMRDKWKNNGGC
jgi:hypothetical protein